jgi:hypothetical protein
VSPPTVPEPSGIAYSGAETTLRGSAYPAPWRFVAAILRIVCGASLPLILVLVLTVNDPPITPPVLLRLFAILAVVPAAAGWLIRRAGAVDVCLTADTLRLARRDVEIDIPVGSIQRLVPWRIPLPGAGFSLRLRSGRRFRWGLVLDDPHALLGALAGASEGARSITAHPTVIYAQAKAPYAYRTPLRLAAKFPGFALLPASVLFYTHQHIAYGGLLGEYYLLGLSSYLTTFAVYWCTTTIYLILWASLWRGVVEATCLLTAWTIPAAAAAVRRWGERASAVMYYGGVPAVLALRYFA